MIVKYAIVGLGRSGFNIHYKSLIKKKNFKLLAVCDKNKLKLKLIQNKENVYKTLNYKEILRLHNINLVIISTNTIDIYKIAKFFLCNKINVVIEKPFTKNQNQFNELINTANKNNSKFFPFFNFRFYEDYLLIKSLIKSNKIGKIFQIKRNESYFNRREDWQSSKKQLGGIINASAIHQIDQILNLIKIKPKKILKYSNNIISKGDADDHCKLIIVTSDVLFDLESSWVNPIKTYNWIIYGSHGVIYQKEDVIKLKFYNDNKIKKLKRSKFSYLSSEKIQWNEKKYFLKNNNDIYSSRKFYSDLLLNFNNTRLYKKNINSSLHTISFINKYCYEK